MPYTTPITDRILSDVTTPTSKGYFNVADWTRIYDNAEIVNGLLETEIGVALSFATISYPTVETVANSTFLYNHNMLLENIERIRSWCATYLSTYLPDLLSYSIKCNWDVNEPSFNFNHVNQWENTIALIYNVLSSWTPPSVSGNLDLADGGSLQLADDNYLELA